LDWSEFIFLIFIFVLGIFSSILFMPVNIYSGFYLEHKYKLSNQTFYKYFVENLKSMLVGLVIGVPILIGLTSFSVAWFKTYGKEAGSPINFHFIYAAVDTVLSCAIYGILIYGSI